MFFVLVKVIVIEKDFCGVVNVFFFDLDVSYMGILVY